MHKAEPYATEGNEDWTPDTAAHPTLAGGSACELPRSGPRALYLGLMSNCGGGTAALAESSWDLAIAWLASAGWPVCR